MKGEGQEGTSLNKTTNSPAEAEVALTQRPSTFSKQVTQRAAIAQNNSIFASSPPPKSIVTSMQSTVVNLLKALARKHGLQPRDRLWPDLGPWELSFERCDGGGDVESLGAADGEDSSEEGSGVEAALEQG